MELIVKLKQLENKEHVFRCFTWNILYCEYNKTNNIDCKKKWGVKCLK